MKNSINAKGADALQHTATEMGMSSGRARRAQTLGRAVRARRVVALFAVLAIMPAFSAAQQLNALASNGAGAISAVASAQVGQDQFVTAVRNGSGNLEVVAWYADLSANSNLSLDPLLRQGTNYGGPVSGGSNPIAITSAFGLNAGISESFITAMVNGSGNLDLSYWQVQSGGSISLVSELETGPALAVSVAAVYSQSGRQQFMTATENEWGNLEVSLWYLDSSSQIQWAGTQTAGGVSEVSIACLHDSISDVITAVRNSLGDLELVQWYYGRFGTAVTRGNTFYGTAASHIAAAAVPLFGQAYPLYTADLISSQAFPQGQLNVDDWNIQGSISGFRTDTTIPSTQVALTAADTAALAVGILGQSGPYIVDVFDTASAWGEVTAGYGAAASAVSISPVNASSHNSTVFAVSYENSYGNLQIQLWQYVKACSPNCPI